MPNRKPLQAKNIPENPTKSLYPAPFAAQMNGRIKRKLGDFFGLSNFGINLTELQPGAKSALKHHHLTQDEFIYILSGTPTLIYGDDEYPMQPGECFGFTKGIGIGHQLVNHTNQPASYLEIGDRSPDDQVEYPDDDLKAITTKEGQWKFLHKDGREYES